MSGMLKCRNCEFPAVRGAILKMWNCFILQRFGFEETYLPADRFLWSLRTQRVLMGATQETGLLEISKLTQKRPIDEHYSLNICKIRTEVL